MTTDKHHAGGFTLIEIAITMGIIAILIATVSQTLFQSRATASLSTTASQIINDARGQQMFAMLGATPSAGLYTDYSILFGTTSYTLFPGDVYVSTDSGNFTVALEGPLTFASVTLPSRTLTFTRLSGDVANFTSGQDSVTLQDSQSGVTKVLQVNRRGIFLKGQ